MDEGWMHDGNQIKSSIFPVQEGQELIQEQPELRSVVQQKLEEIRECWSELETTTKAQARQLFEQKPELEVKSYSELDDQLSHLEQQPPQLEQTHYLPTVSEQLQKTKASLKPPGPQGPRPPGSQGPRVPTSEESHSWTGLFMKCTLEIKL